LNEPKADTKLEETLTTAPETTLMTQSEEEPSNQYILLD
jgi:hypothetical protein